TRLLRSLEPRDGFLQATPKRNVRLEAEQFLRPRSVQATARLTVGLCRIVNEFAFETYYLRDQRGQLADANLTARSEIDGLGTIVVFGGEYDSAGTIVRIEKLTRRGASTPEHDFGGSTIA